MAILNRPVAAGFWRCGRGVSEGFLDRPCSPAPPVIPHAPSQGISGLKGNGEGNGKGSDAGRRAGYDDASARFAAICASRVLKYLWSRQRLQKNTTAKNTISQNSQSQKMPHHHSGRRRRHICAG